MRLLLLLLTIALLSFSAFAQTTPPGVAVQKPPIIISAQSELAKVDQDTLKVTYTKGTDPKLVVDQVLKAWAQAMSELNSCRETLKKATEKK